MIPDNYSSPISRRISLSASVITACLSLAILVFWINHDPTTEFSMLLPGTDGYSLAAISASREEVALGSIWNLYDSTAVKTSSSWPQFRGANRDNISDYNLNVSKSATDMPLELWSVQLGEGHAGAAIHNGRVYLMDYDEVEKADLLRCFALEDGRELWSRGYKIPIKRNHGISRTVPAVNDSFVVTMGPRCHVMCLDAISGDYLWGMDLVKDYGVEVPFWYTGQCPLIDDNIAVLAVGGKDILMMGVDCRSGEIVWQTPNPDHWKMSHSSIMPVSLYGIRQYVYSAIGGVAAVSSEIETRGNLLWESTLWSNSVIAPSPVQLNGNQLFFTAGYNAGSMLMQVSYQGNQFSADSLRTIRPDQGLASEQQTVINPGDLVCGILPKDGGTLKEEFVCYRENDLTAPVWSSGKTNRYGLGPYMIIGNALLILDDEGELTILKSNVNAYSEIARYKLLEGHDAWAPMAFADGKLLLRDSRTLKCFDLENSNQIGSAR